VNTSTGKSTLIISLSHHRRQAEVTTSHPVLSMVLSCIIIRQDRVRCCDLRLWSHVVLLDSLLDGGRMRGSGDRIEVQTEYAHSFRTDYSARLGLVGRK
jgi:hypothetical protein